VERIVSSSPRFRSQAFSTSQRFPSRLKLRGLVSCHNRFWAPPFRVFPSREIAYPSRGSLASLQLSTGLRKRTALGLVTSGFFRRPRLRAVAWFPPKTMGFLSACRGMLPGRPGLRAAEPFRSASFTYFEASLPPASPFATGSGFPSPAGRYSLGFLPSRAFAFHASESRPVQTRGPEHEIVPLGSRLQGSVTP
jgi:hypothetical protein